MNSPHRPLFWPAAAFLAGLATLTFAPPEAAAKDLTSEGSAREATPIGFTGKWYEIKPKKGVFKARVGGPATIHLNARALRKQDSKKHVVLTVQVKVNGEAVQTFKVKPIKDPADDSAKTKPGAKPSWGYKGAKKVSPGALEKFEFTIGKGVNTIEVSVKSTKSPGGLVWLVKDDSAAPVAVAGAAAGAPPENPAPAGDAAPASPELELVPLVPLEPIEPEPAKPTAQGDLPSLVAPTENTSEGSLLANESPDSNIPPPAPAAVVEDTVESSPAKMMAIGARAGTMTPVTNYGRTGMWLGGDVSYVLPTRHYNMRIGADLGYYKFRHSAELKSPDGLFAPMTLESSVRGVPLLLRFTYRLVMPGPVKPYVSVAGGVFLTKAVVTEKSGASVSDSTVGFGGAPAAGVEYMLGPGAVFAEAAFHYGNTSGLKKAVADFNIIALGAQAGYRAIF